MNEVLCTECEWPSTWNKTECTIAARFICSNDGNYYFCGAFCERGKNGTPPLPGWTTAKWQQIIPEDTYPRPLGVDQ